MKHLKRFNESIFDRRMGDELYVGFDSTHAPFVTDNGQVVGSEEFNSTQHFRERYKKV